MQRNKDVVFCRGNSKQWDYGENEMFVSIPDLHSSLSFLNNKHMHQNLKTNHFRYWTYAADENIHNYFKSKSDASDEIRNNFTKVIRKIIQAYAHNTKEARFIDKSQLFSINIDYINTLLKDINPFFIIILRNPYAMITRAAQKYYINPTKNNLKLTYKESLVYCAQHWKNTFEYAIKDSKKLNNCLILKFEEILEEPEKFIRKICDFTNLTFDIDMLPSPEQRNTVLNNFPRRWFPIRKDANNIYLEHLKQFEIEIIDSICGSLIKEYDYTPTN